MNDRKRQLDKARSMCIAFADKERFKAALLQTIEEDAKYWMLDYDRKKMAHPIIWSQPIPQLVVYGTIDSEVKL